VNSSADVATTLRQAREQFLSAGSMDRVNLRPDVLDSWRRSRDLHVHQDRVDLPFVREPNTDSPLVHAAAPVLRRVADDLAAQAVSVILTSADGVVLERVCSDASIVSALDSVRLSRGYSYAEEFVGTNGIGTSLETGRPTYIRGAEHYLGTLGRLACAGAPIRDNLTGKVVGVIDLTCWDNQSNPLLLALAKSAGSQIEDRMNALTSENESALLETYLRHTHRFPMGVLAIGGDVVLMNPYLRQALDAGDQIALLEHASDLRDSDAVSTAVVELPTGGTAKISAVERISIRGRGSYVVFQIRLAVEETARRFGPESTIRPGIPGLAGRSSSWHRSCQQIERCYRDQDWVVVDGETGSGRAKIAQSVAQHVDADKMVRVLRVENFASAEDFVTELVAVTDDDDDFAAVLTDVDRMSADVLDTIVAVLQSCAGRGWIAATMNSANHASQVESLLLPFFTHTVTVPALRHRIEDLEVLVPFLLRDITRGADVRLAPEAMRQLGKLPWPGNVAQLRQVLVETVAQQRSGVIAPEKLPPECRSLARRKLSQIEALERDAIVRSLRENGGNKADAAQALGMSRATIYRKVKDFGIA
jgi:sigma-54 dependent transcriptional regulator, acetoin dehydrogenase operon transcriptional activator AcoR